VKREKKNQFDGDWIFPLSGISCQDVHGKAERNETRDSHPEYEDAERKPALRSDLSGEWPIELSHEALLATKMYYLVHKGFFFT
jgi:hypothetical protein